MPEPPTLPPIATEPLSVVLLARDDAGHVGAVVSGWVNFLNGLGRDYEVLLVDDGSADRTADLASELALRHGRLKVLRHREPRGEGAALATALKAARYPLLFYARCEPRYRPSDLKRLSAEIDRVHLVSGYRAGRPVPWPLRALGLAYRAFCRLAFSHAPAPLPGWLGWRRHAGALLARVFFGVRNRDVACPYRLARRAIFARIPIQSDGPFAHVEILAKANFLGHLLGEEVPLGDRDRPVVPEGRRGGGAGRVVREAARVFRRPDFGPPPGKRAGG
jgi:glycosyltransferase involved in cell wall biosynthesis